MSRLDRESFQTLLGNAFAVQESGLNPQILAAFVEIQQFISSSEFDLDRAIHMIADCALRVSNATGVAIAQMVGEELVYRAGIGSAAENVGHRIPAVLAASSPERQRREILRVENAMTDRRIESEICRQFGAAALIMLPIHQHDGLAGVLQVLFTEPHSFVDREVRAYQLLVGAIEDGIARLERTSELREQRPTRVENVQPKLLSADQPARIVVPRWQPAVMRMSSSIKIGMKSCRDLGSRVTGELSGLKTRVTRTARRNVERLSAVDLSGPVENTAAIWGTLRSRVRRARSMAGDWFMRVARKDVSRLWLSSLRASEGAIIAVVLLMAAVWVVSRGHLPSRGTHVTESATTQSVIPAATKAVVAAQQTEAPTNQNEPKALSKGPLKRVRAGSDEVEYIGDDVTIRRFASVPAKHAVTKNVREKNFGDDVTVRYFAEAPGAGSRPSTSVSRPAAAKEPMQSR